MPQSSATIGLPGDRESQIKLQAKHSDMCKFNPNDAVDKKNYKFVEGNVLELCEKSLQLGKKQHSSVDRLPGTSADTVDSTILPGISSATVKESMESSASRDQGHEDLERRLYNLREPTNQ